MLISPKEKILVAGATGMAGSAICRSLINKGYGDPKKNGRILTPSRKELDLLDPDQVKNWFHSNKPSIVILQPPKLEVYTQILQPVDFLLKNLKIQNNIIETSWNYGIKRLFFGVAVFILNLQNNQSKKNIC